MRICMLGLTAFLLAISTVGLAQEPSAPQPINPFGDGGGGQPPAPPAADPFGGLGPGVQPASPDAIAAPAATGGDQLGADPEKEQAWFDDMIKKKVVIKTQLKGKLASLWIGAPFLELAEPDQQMVIRLAYKALVGKEDFKIPPTMTIYASDGQRQGPLLGRYKTTPKGEELKLTLPRPQQQQPDYVPEQPLVPPPGVDPDDF